MQVVSVALAWVAYPATPLRACRTKTLFVCLVGICANPRFKNTYCSYREIPNPLFSSKSKSRLKSVSRFKSKLLIIFFSSTALFINFPLLRNTKRIPTTKQTINRCSWETSMPEMFASSVRSLLISTHSTILALFWESTTAWYARQLAGVSPSFTSLFCNSSDCQLCALCVIHLLSFYGDYYQNWIALTAFNWDSNIFTFHATAVNAKRENRTFSLPNECFTTYCLNVLNVRWLPLKKKKVTNGRNP